MRSAPAPQSELAFAPEVYEQLEQVLEMSRSPTGETSNNVALCWAAARNYHKVVILLVQKYEVDVNNTSFWGNKTPLMFAIGNGNDVIADFLLQKGADPDAKDRLGETPLTKACRKGNLAGVKLLILHKANLTSRAINIAYEMRSIFPKNLNFTRIITELETYKAKLSKNASYKFPEETQVKPSIYQSVFAMFQISTYANYLKGNATVEQDTLSVQAKRVN